MTSDLLKKPVVWIVLLIASALCVFGVLHWFGTAFSVLDLDVRMSRAEAIDQARRVATDLKLSTVTLSDAAAGFSGDPGSQTFIELEGGGKPALKPLIDGSDEFTLYKWRVRLYSPSVEREVQIAFTPDGRLSGFYSKVPEAEPGAALTADEARAIAVATAARDWGVDFARFRALTASAVTQPGKRIDHEFVYERLLDGAPPIGEGRLRLRMVVSGDRLTNLQRYVHVPEAFGRRYETMRSVNNNIAAAASVAAGLLYGLGGCLIGLIWLMRRHAVRWGPSAKWAGVVALLITGASLASIAGSWFAYDTARSASTHLFERIGNAAIGGVTTWLLLTVVFATAEGLGRLAFGAHPQLWRSWLLPSAQSRAIWGRTLAGYAWIGFDLAFIAIFYFVVQRYLGWWSPSDALIDPNILGTPQPWLAPVSMALQAGMMEEALFRAVPLAGAALLGRHFGHEKRFVLIALVLQAIVFGCAHANYPGQPAYARPIELFVPALVWGLVYLRYGLVPGMLFHFGFDLVLMSLPLFVTDAPGVVFDRAMVIGVLSLPLIVLTVQRFRAGRLIDLPDSERNAARSPPTGVSIDEVVPVLASVDEPRAVAPIAPRSRRDNALLVVFALAGLVGLGVRIAQPLDAPPLQLSRSEAMSIAEKALEARGVKLDERWHRTARAVAVSDGGGVQFAWREGGQALYARLIGNTLMAPHWDVRYARFDGDVADRETWRVTLLTRPDGSLDRPQIVHDLPEGRPGKRLTEAEARPIAEAAIAAWAGRPATSLRAVSAQATERPSRVDWVFRYADPAVVMPSGGEARLAVEIAGDEVVDYDRSVFVPDAWSREQRGKDEKLVVPRALLRVLEAAFAIACVVSLVRRLVRGEASRRAAWVAATLVVVTMLASRALDFNATEFDFTVAEPYQNQLLRFALQLGGGALAGALVAALVASVGVRIAGRTEDPAPADAGRWHRWGPAIAVALLLVGGSGLAGLVAPRTSPHLPAVDAADSLAPVVRAFIGNLDFTATAAAALIGAAVLASRRRRIEAIIAVGFVAAALLGQASTPDTTPLAIALSGLAGWLGWWIYRSQLRDRPGVVAPMMLCIAVLGVLPGLVHPGYPQAVMAAVAGLVATGVGYAIWRWLVKADERDGTVAGRG